MSTNPWKVTSTFQCVCSTQEEYIAWLDGLKKTAPPEAKAGERRTKPELGHIALIKAAEERLPAIEAELLVSLAILKCIGWSSPTSRILNTDGQLMSSHVEDTTCEEEGRAT